MRRVSELFSRRSFENPTYPLDSDAIHSILSVGGGTAAGVHITPETALRIGAAFRCTQIIASSVAGLPLKVTRTSDRAEVPAPAINGHNDYQTAYERWETSAAHMALWGNAYLWKVRGAGGKVERLIPVHPSRVTVEVVNEQDLGGLYRRYTVDGNAHVTSYEVLHIPCMSLDGVQGLSPIAATREMFGVAASAEMAAGKLFANGLMLSGFLSTDQELNEGKAQALKRRWARTLQGAEHAGDVAILDQGAKYESLAIPPRDVQFLEARKFQITEIARMFGVPGWMINDQEKSTSWGSGMEQQWATFMNTTLKPYTQRIEQRVTAELLSPTGGQAAEFKFEGLLRGDSAQRAAFYNAGITGQWLVPNEVREWENLPPREGGDEPVLPNNTSAEAQSSGDDTTDDSPEEDES